MNILVNILVFTLGSLFGILISSLLHANENIIRDDTEQEEYLKSYSRKKK